MSVIAVTLALTGTARAAAPQLGDDGTTAPVFDYTQATRERVFIPQPGIDQDANGVADKVVVDVIRPKESGPAVKVPAIVVPSPYFTTACIGNRGECMGDKDSDGVNDLWPLFLDNYFVPRGYAVVLAQMNGTGYATDGCPRHGGAGDIAGEKSVIDWLNGRAAAVDKNGAAVSATWHNGSSAMIGKSYDGTLANGVATTGVAGLKTIVPISAISSWYDYSREGGIRTTGTHYPTSLDTQITSAARRPACTAVNTQINGLDGDATGDYNAFWAERDYVTDVANVGAAVFAVHGFQDDNVKLGQLWPWWQGLAASGVPRKLWLLRGGHVDPFDSRRAVWVDTLHRWFDHWLYAIPNGIETGPRVTIEDERDVWHDYADWPVPGTAGVDAFLRATTQADPGTLRGTSGGPLDSVSFTGAAGTAGTLLAASVETNAIGSLPAASQANRRVFLSPPLATSVGISGEAIVHLRAALSTAQSNLGAILVDYATEPFDEVTRSGEGIQNTATQTCWGDNGTYDNACYAEVTKPLTHVTQWRVAHGILDSSNRNSLTTADPAVPGQAYDFTIPLQPTEHTFAAGHRIGIVIAGNLYGAAGTPSAQITVDTKLSRATLPIAGGTAAALASGLTDETAATTTATMSPDAAWHRTPATVTLAADDGAGSGVQSITYSTTGAPTTVAGATATLSVAAEGVTTVHFASTDRAGNEEPEQTVTVQIDRTAPAPRCPADAAWHATNVRVGCTASDAGSGIATSAFSLATAVPAGAETASAAATRAVCDVAGNCATARLLRKVDRRAPAVTLTTPGTTEVARGAVVAVRHACADGGSGVASCAGPARLDTTAAGPHALTVTGRDAVGNARTARWAYTVLGSVPKLRVRAATLTRSALKITLTGRLRATVRITGTLAAGGHRARVRPLSVSVAPGVTRTVTLKLPKALRGARRMTAALRLASTAGGLRRTDKVRLRAN
jgi:X-Pro dipeptidyl-peptidase